MLMKIALDVFFFVLLLFWPFDFAADQIKYLNCLNANTKRSKLKQTTKFNEWQIVETENKRFHLFYSV